MLARNAGRCTGSGATSNAPTTPPHPRRHCFISCWRFQCRPGPDLAGAAAGVGHRPPGTSSTCEFADRSGGVQPGPSGAAARSSTRSPPPAKRPLGKGSHVQRHVGVPQRRPQRSPSGTPRGLTRQFFSRFIEGRAAMFARLATPRSLSRRRLPIPGAGPRDRTGGHDEFGCCCPGWGQRVVAGVVTVLRSAGATPYLRTYPRRARRQPRRRIHVAGPAFSALDLLFAQAGRAQPRR